MLDSGLTVHALAAPLQLSALHWGSAMMDAVHVIADAGGRVIGITELTRE